VPEGDGGRRHPGDGALSAARGRVAVVVLWAAAAAGPAWCQQVDPGTLADAARPRRVEQVTVTATRQPARIEDVPASVAVLPRAELDASAAPTLDDALRQVVGFSLFRRSGSRFANPTAQGVSLRGLGASGASRALVLVDGLPLNDPFGGWVYWARVPWLSIERLEVLRGGASDLYGTSALGGVVQAVTRPPGSGPVLDGELSAGGLGTYDGSLSAGGIRGDWGARVSAQAFRSTGYVPIASDVRGPVDVALSSRHAAVDGLVERRLDGGRLFARAAAYGEDRGNGTPLQTNDTRVVVGALGADWGAPEGAWSARGWGQSQLYHQAFTAVAADRASEDLTRLQRVPASAFGLSLQRSQTLGSRQRLLVGIDARSTSGTTQETLFARATASARVAAGGRERTAAVFVEDLVQPSPRLLLAASARLDGCWHESGRSTTTQLAGGADSTTAFANRSESALSPRLALLFRAGHGVSLLASGYGAFRGPTLNELYRSFRLGDTLTRANPELAAERLRGAEAGALVARGPATLRLTAFAAQVRDAIANVTVSSTPALITRERRNLGRLWSRGIEAEGELRLGSRAVLSAGYALTDARVASFAADPTLEGRWIPQVPRHQLTAQARYDADWRLGLQARWTSSAYEDDRNRLVLDPGWQLDARLARALAGGLEAFVAAENLLGATIVVARTPLPSVAPPRVARVGVRVRLGRRP
jgi:outer membrane receptor protein involved in Fe transport